MYDVLVRMLNMSLAAGMLVPVILLLRLLLKKVPKNMICLLWAVAALRLLCPFTVSSSLSVYNLLGDSAGNSGRIEYFQYNEMSEKPQVEFALPKLVNADYSPDSMTIGEHVSKLYLPAAAGLWLTGTAVMLLYALFSYMRLRRMAAVSAPLYGNVRIAENIPSPFILGICRPVIYVPAGMNPEIRKYVLGHEEAHLGRRDHWWKPLGYLLLSVYWFNPLLWIAYILFCCDIEMACDERAVRDMDRTGKAAYSQALLDCSFPRSVPSACPLAFGEVGVKRRVKQVLHAKKPALWILAAAAVLCAAAAMSFLTNPLPGKDSIRLAAREDLPYFRLEYSVKLGGRTNGGMLLAERWQNGSCVSTEPLVFDASAEKLYVSVIPHQAEAGSPVHSFEVQYYTDRTEVIMPQQFFMEDGEPAQGYAFTSMEPNEIIRVESGTELSLAALALDHGNGVSAVSCRSPESVKKAADAIVIRAVFTEMWDCSVECAEKSVDGAYIITYSETHVSPSGNCLTFRNPNSFAIDVHLTGGDGPSEESVLHLPAGGSGVFREGSSGMAMQVGIHAEVEQFTEIRLEVWDGANQIIGGK